MNGKKEWYFPDAYLPDISDGVSHESVCVLNVGEEEAHIKLILYFETDAVMEGFEAVCGPMRTNHIRLDRIKSKFGADIPRSTPYAICVKSDVPVLCQYTRVDATLPAHALMTAMGL